MQGGGGGVDNNNRFILSLLIKLFISGFIENKWVSYLQEFSLRSKDVHSLAKDCLPHLTLMKTCGNKGSIG